MAAKVSQLISGGIRNGKEMKTSVATVEPGLLVKQDSGGSTVSLAGLGTAYGIAYGNRTRVYAPTTRVFGNDEPLTVIWGNGEFLLSSDFFVGGTLPSAGDTLYAAASGLWSTSGSSVDKVGDVIAIRTRQEPVGGTGSSQSLAHIRFNIVP